MFYTSLSILIIVLFLAVLVESQFSVGQATVSVE